MGHSRKMLNQFRLIVFFKALINFADRLIITRENKGQTCIFLTFLLKPQCQYVNMTTDLEVLFSIFSH